MNSSVGDTHTYDAFGILIGQEVWNPGTGELETVSTSNAQFATPNLYLYCGEQYDPSLGMYHLRARYLNPDTGRFWSMDTYEGDDENPITLHKYMYANGSPPNGLDPSGNMTMTEITYVQKEQQELRAKELQKVQNAKKMKGKLFKALLQSSIMFNIGVAQLTPHTSAASLNWWPIARFNQVQLARLARTSDGALLKRAASNMPKFLTIVTFSYGSAYYGGKREFEKVNIKVNGFPDFGDVLRTGGKSVVYVKYTGTRRGDRTVANRKVLQTNGKNPPNTVWHHNEVMGIMECVQKKPHTRVPHYGGVFYYKMINANTYPGSN